MSECPETWLAARLAAGKPAEAWADMPGWWYKDLGLPIPPGASHRWSDQGRVMSPRGTILADQPSNRPESAPPELRYRLVKIRTGGKEKTVTVHSGVLFCFGDPAHKPGRRPEGMHTSHENDVPSHNWTENLRWRPPDGPDGNEQRKAPETRAKASAAGRAAQVAAGMTVGGTLTPHPCRNRARSYAWCTGMAHKEGSRCKGCAEQIGRDTSVLLAAGLNAQAVGEFFGCTGGEWVLSKAVECGGWPKDLKAQARMQRPTLRQRVRLFRLKHGMRGH